MLNIRDEKQRIRLSNEWNEIKTKNVNAQHWLLFVQQLKSRETFLFLVLSEFNYCRRLNRICFLSTIVLNSRVATFVRSSLQYSKNMASFTRIDHA